MNLKLKGFGFLIIVLASTCLQLSKCEPRDEGEESDCPDDQFSCLDKRRCIPTSSVCDQFPNCLDHSDEDEELCENWEYDYDYDSDDDDEISLWDSLVGGSEDFGADDDDENEEVKSEYPGKESEDEKQPPKELNPEMCSLKKCLASGILGYVDDYQYEYSYEVIAETELQKNGEAAQVTSITVKADVVLHVLTACEMSLKMSNVMATTSTSETGGESTKMIEEDEFLKSLGTVPLRFSMISGQVDSVCPSPDENIESLNFKKGIVSMLQNSMPELHLPHRTVEKDVVGECEMEYDFVGAKGSHTVVSKTKNMDTCKGRSHLRTSTIGIPYYFPGATESIPIIDSTGECQQEILRGVFRSITCNEENSLTPLRSGQGGITNIVKQQLTYNQQTFAKASYDKFSGRTDLRYDFLPPHGEDMKLVGDPALDPSAEEQLLDSLVSLENVEESSSVPHLAEVLAKTVASIKKMSFDQLKSFYHERNWGVHDKGLFDDALPMAGTAASIRLMVELISQGEVDPDTASLWAYSIVSIPNPTEEIVEAASGMLTLDAVPREAFLSVGGLVNTYCTKYPLCSSHHPIKKILTIYDSFISTGCIKTKSEDKIKVLFALKGIGNAGLAVDDSETEDESKSLLTNLNQCIKEPSNEIEIKVTAIEAYRRFSCTVPRTGLKDIFVDLLEDSELRIAAYLSLMRCADYEMASSIEEILQKEEVNQVGSFVWTHLTNLKETGMPSKAELQALLSNKDFEQKFQSDVRKFSRNMEWSGFYDEMNAGASVESNLIFSQTSYVPRSASLNLTLDLFGRSFNVFEIGTRLEGFDRYLNSLLERAFPHQPEPNPTNGVNNRQINQMIAKSEFAKKYKEKEAELSFNMKLFGNDFFYKHLHGMDKIISTFQHLRPEEILQSFKTGKEFSLQRVWMPLDSSYYLATSAGLPLSLNIEGTASVDVSAQAQVDLVQLLTTGKGKIKGHLKPNLNMNMRATMILDAHTAQTGVEMTADFQSSVALDGLIQIDGLRVINVDLNMPQDVVEIFSIKSELLMIHESAERVNSDQTSTRSKLPVDDFDYSATQGCSPFAEQLGSKLCWNFQLPRATSRPTQDVLLHGPVNFSILFKKDDLSLKSYSFRYQFEKEEDFTTFLLSLDTPNTSTSREHSLRLTLNYLQRDVFFLLKTPIHFTEFKGRYTWNANAKKLYGYLNMNNEAGASIDIGYQLYEKGSAQTITPHFMLTWKDEEIVDITGNLEARDRPDGTEGDEGMDFYYSVDLKFSLNIDGRTEGTVSGYLNTINGEFDANLEFQYSLMDNEGNKKKEEHIAFNYQRVMKLTNNLMKYDGSWKVVFTEFPNLNCKGKLASKQFQGTIENVLQVSFGENFEDPKYNVDVYQNFAFYGGFDSMNINATLSIKYPNKNLDVKIGGDFSYDGVNFDTGFILQYAADKAMSTRFHLARINYNGRTHIEITCHLAVPMWVNIKFAGNIKEQARNVYQFDFLGSYGDYYKVELDGIYRDLSTNLKTLYRVEFQLKLPSIDAVKVNSTFLNDVNQIGLLVQVKLSSGDTYKVRLAYTTDQDIKSPHNRFEVDLYIREQLYYWHAEISYGEFVTIANDIHIDRFRDINLWLQLQKKKDYWSLETKLQWDVNRDPLKKASSKLVITSGFFSLKSSITFLGNDYDAEWVSSREYFVDGMDTVRGYDHKGVLSWKDEHRKLHELAAGAKFNMRRGNGTNISSFLYLTTPFEDWKNNSMQILYSRNDDHILASMNAKWHQNEFMTSRLSFKKMIVDCNLFSFDSVLNTQSSIKGLFSFSAGGKVERRRNILDSNVFVEWEQDRIELVLEAEDARTADEFRVIISAKVMTTLLGYELIGTYLDISAMKGQAILLSSAKWNDALYEVRAIGQLYSAQEYLKGELSLSTPDGPNVASTSLRIYHDPLSWEERIELTANWFSIQYHLKGRFKHADHNYGLGVSLITPVGRLPQASLDLSVVIEDQYKVAALVHWNNSGAFGVDAFLRPKGLTDFAIGANILTPYPNYREIRAELSNLFSMDPAVKVRSKIFGQFNDRKFGVGCRYENAQLPNNVGEDEMPRLRVGLELYSPIKNLREVKFEISDNSTSTEKRYLIEMTCGSDKNINIETNFIKSENVNEAYVRARLNLPFLGPEFETITIESGGKLTWRATKDFEVNLLAETKTKTISVRTMGSMLNDNGGSIEGSIILPIEEFEDVHFACNYRPLRPDLEGYLDLKMKIGPKKKISLNAIFRHGEMTLSFSSPFENYRDGTFRYKLFPLDVRRSRIDVSAMVEGQKISMEGEIYLNEEYYVTKLEGTLLTPFEGFEKAQVAMDGYEEGGQFVNKFVLSGKDRKYTADVIWKYRSERDWKVKVKVVHSSRDYVEDYSGEFEFRNVLRKPLRIAANIQSPKSILGDRSFEVEVQSTNIPYNIQIKWHLATCEGSLDFVLREFVESNISSMAKLAIQIGEGSFHQFIIDLNLLNNNPPELPVDIAVDLKLSTNHEKWNELSVSGELKEITDEPGRLSITLKWPQMEPVVFRVTANYEGTSDNLSVESDLSFGSAFYTSSFRIVRRTDKLTGIGCNVTWRMSTDEATNEIKFESTFSFTRRKTTFTAGLFLPQPYNSINSSLDVLYESNRGSENFRAALSVGDFETLIEGHTSRSESNGVEGQIIFKSERFWDSHPIIFNFTHTLKGHTFKGEYKMEWPTFSRNTEKYETQLLQATLSHTIQENVSEGSFELFLPIAKGKPVTLFYIYAHGGIEESITLGGNFQGITLRVKALKILMIMDGTTTQRKALELDNPLWPFGIAYVRTISTMTQDNQESPRDTTYDSHAVKRSERLIIYDLNNPGRQSHVSFTKEIIKEGKKLVIKANFINRELELSGGYRWGDLIKSVESLASWGPNQWISCHLTVSDNSELPDRQFNLLGNVSYPLQTAILSGSLKKQMDNVVADLVFDWDIKDPGKKPITLTLTSVRKDKNYLATLNLNHDPSLARPIELQMDLQHDSGSSLPRSLDGTLIYSDDDSKNIAFSYNLDTTVKNSYSYDFSLDHSDSNLHISADGNFVKNYPVYIFSQEVAYSDYSGVLHRMNVVGKIDLANQIITAKVDQRDQDTNLEVSLSEISTGLWQMQAIGTPGEAKPVTMTMIFSPSQKNFIFSLENLRSGNVEELAKSEKPRYLADKVVIGGGLADRRHAHLSVEHGYPTLPETPEYSSEESNSANEDFVWTTDATFFLRLNHSRLLSSHMRWRREVIEELRTEAEVLLGSTSELRSTVMGWVDSVSKKIGEEISNRSRPIINDLSMAIYPLVIDFKNNTQEFKMKLVMMIKTTNFTSQEQQHLASLNYIMKNFMKTVNDLPFVKEVREQLAKGTMRKQIIAQFAKIKGMIKYFLNKYGSSKGMTEYLHGFLDWLVTTYNQSAKRAYLTFCAAMRDFNERLRDWVRNRWHNVYYNYKPHIMHTFHVFETASHHVISRLTGYMSHLQEDFHSLSYVQILQGIYSKVHKVYKKLSEGSLKENFTDVYEYVSSSVETTFNLVLEGVLPFVKDWVEDVQKAWLKFNSFKSVGSVTHFVREFAEKVYWLLGHLNIRDRMLTATAFILEKGTTIMSQTALQAQMKHTIPKTKMMWYPNEGRIEFDQKLPFTWIALDEKPRWKEMLEIPILSYLRSFFFPSIKLTVLDTWYKYFNLNFYPHTWIPPFTAKGYVVGGTNFLTFDGQLLNMKGNCEYVLALDRILSQWAVTIMYHHASSKTIHVYVDGKNIEFSSHYKVKIDGKLIGTPFEENRTEIWRSSGGINLIHKSGLFVYWNLEHDVVSITIPRSGFLHTAGLLGNYNNEPYDDLQTPSEEILSGKDQITAFLESWEIISDECETSLHVEEELVHSDQCSQLFDSESSPFRYCFYQVDPSPFLKICQREFSGSIESTCSSSFAYREKCVENTIPIKVPHYCVRCHYERGQTEVKEKLLEGESVVLKSEEAHSATDVVLVVERKECNKDLLQSKYFSKFLSAFENGINKGGMTSTRYALVTYAGSAVDETAVVASIDKEVFTTTKRLIKIINKLKFEPEDEIPNEELGFFALNFATGLPFRASVGVTILFFPCQPCEPTDRLDFATMYHILANSGASLHAFKRDAFTIAKTSLAKKILGYDKDKAYQLNDYKKDSMGSSSIQKQIKPPKEELKFCYSLALQTNGTIYTSDLLKSKKKKKVERFGTLVGRRAALSAKQDSDQRCLCLSSQEVTPIMRCDRWDRGDFSTLEQYGLELGTDVVFGEKQYFDNEEHFYQKEVQ